MVLNTFVAVVFALDAADVGFVDADVVGDAGELNAGMADKSSSSALNETSN